MNNTHQNEEERNATMECEEEMRNVSNEEGTTTRNHTHNGTDEVAETETAGETAADDERAEDDQARTENDSDTTAAVMSGQYRIASKYAATYAAFRRNVRNDQPAGESNTNENERVASSTNTFAQDHVAEFGSSQGERSKTLNDERDSPAPATETFPTSGVANASDPPSSTNRRSTGNPTTFAGEGGSSTAAERLDQLRRSWQSRQSRQSPGVHHVPRRAPGLPVISSSRRPARFLSRRGRSTESSSENVLHVVPEASLVEPEPVLEYATAVEATPWIKERKTILTFILFFVAAVATAVFLVLDSRPSKDQKCPEGSFPFSHQDVIDEITGIANQWNDTNSYHEKAFQWIKESSNVKNLCNAYAVRQRYVSALLYFNVKKNYWDDFNANESYWDEDTTLLLEKSVCAWNVGEIGLFCDKNDENITRIMFDEYYPQDSIPPEIGYLTELKVLDIFALTGTIPGQIGNLTNLEELIIEGDINGTIPSQLGNLLELNHLDLAEIPLTGTIPAEIGNLKNLTHLCLFNTDLTGTMPSSLGSLSELKELLVFSNLLTGTIPSELGSITMLEVVELQNNFLHGVIPSEISNLAQLQYLIMDQNYLFGTIPSELCRLEELNELSLASNSLNGTILVEIGNLEGLSMLDLSENMLTGTIPAQLGDIESLETLNLEFNKLSGTIPTELGETEQLKFLYLCCNNLTGMFPHKVDDEITFLVVEIFSNDVTGNFSSWCEKDRLRLKVDCEYPCDTCECCKCVS